MGKEISPEKLRDMVRSILPSRYRTGPRREKENRKRSHRRQIREEVTHVDPETTKADLYRDVRVSDIVQGRRGGDKLHHFFRWCHAMTAGMTTEEALAFVRGILPRNVIGDHAYGHWEQEIKPYWRSANFPIWIPNAEERRFQSRYDSMRFRLRRALDEDPALQGVLNRMIKARKKIDEPRRMLLGVHDVDDFVHHILTYKCTDVELRCVMQMIEQVEKGGLAAALQFLVSSRAESRDLGGWRHEACALCPARPGPSTDARDDTCYGVFSDWSSSSARFASPDRSYSRSSSRARATTPCWA